MYSYIFNVTNLIILIIFGVFEFAFWSPYLKNKRTDGTVENYVHPFKGDKRELTFVCKIMYRDEKGRKKYCYSKQVFDTLKEAAQYYPKGAKVQIRVFHEASGDEYDQAMIVSDFRDKKRSLFFTLAALVCCTACAFGFQMYQYYFGSN